MVLLVTLGMFLCVLWIDAAFAQLTAIPTIEITSPSQGQQVSVGELTISGTSADNATTNCQVDADWNDQKPYQKTLATGPSGVNDYSNWTFTYTRDYHLITTGTNDLTAKLSCVDNSIPVAWDTVDVLGISTTTSNNTVDVLGTTNTTTTTTTTTNTSNVRCININDQIGISKLINATNITNATTTRVTLPS